MMQPNRPAGCLSDLMLDSWSSHELDASASDRTSAHLSTCLRCQQRHAELEAVRAEFYAAAPSFSAITTRKGKSKRTNKRLLVGSGLVALLAAAAAIVILPSLPDTRQKGGLSFGYFVKRGDRVFQGERDSALYAGDLVRFTYSSRTPRYLALFSRDALAATVYFPTGDRAERVQSAGNVGLDFSVELDEVLGEERVYALFCAESFELEPLLSALRETGQLPVPSDCQQLSLELHKVAAP